MSKEILFIYLVFFVLAAWTWVSPTVRESALRRNFTQWQLDFIGLTIHGTMVPLFQTFVIFEGLSVLFPQGRGTVSLPALLSFLLNFVVVDYLYYWNHRGLHLSQVWRYHSVHHSGESFDVFTTSRNSALSSFLILYVWVNGLCLYLLEDPVPFAWGVAISNGLDLLRHARIESWLEFFPFNLFISSKEHAWHHSRDRYGVNFGGNFNLWDRCHGTYYSNNEMPEQIGSPLQEENLWVAFWKGSQ